MRLVIYIATMAAVWLVAGISRSDALMVLAIGMALFLACSFLLARIAAKLLDASLRTDSAQVVRGEAARFSLNATNRCVLPVCAFDIRLKLGYRQGQVAPSGLVVSGVVGGRTQVSVPVLASAPHCGVLWMRVDRVSASDPLGLFAVRRRPDTRDAAARASLPVVPPRGKSLGVPLGASAAIVRQRAVAESPARAGALPPDVEQVRLYRPGDPLHAIHWKLSSRSQDVYVKEFPDEQGVDAIVVCDLGLRVGCRATPEDYDAIVGAVGRLSRALISRGLTHMLGWMGTGEPGRASMPCSRIVREEADVEAALRALVGTGVPYEAAADDAAAPRDVVQAGTPMRSDPPDPRSDHQANADVSTTQGRGDRFAEGGIAAGALGRPDLAQLWSQVSREGSCPGDTDAITTDMASVQGDATAIEAAALYLRLDLDLRLFHGARVIAHLDGGRSL